MYAIPRLNVDTYDPSFFTNVDSVSVTTGSSFKVQLAENAPSTVNYIVRILVENIIFNSSIGSMWRQSICVTRTGNSFTNQNGCNPSITSNARFLLSHLVHKQQSWHTAIWRSAILHVEGSRRNVCVVNKLRVQVTTPSNTSQPGTPVDFRLEGTANALVAMTVVDARLAYVESSLPAQQIPSDNMAPMWLWMVNEQSQDQVTFVSLFDK